jgi:hypothetical protein
MLKNRLIVSSLISGLSTLLICVLLYLFQLPWLILYFLISLPGLIYGIIISIYSPTAGEGKRVLFVIFSSIINFVCFMLTDVGERFPLPFYFKILVSSSAASILLFICYYLLIVKCDFVKTFLKFSAVGFFSAIPSAIFYYLMSISKEDSLIGSIFYCGLFTIYPIWQTWFAIVLTKINKYNAIT